MQTYASLKLYLLLTLNKSLNCNTVQEKNEEIILSIGQL